MFRKFRESPYSKVALVILICGALLIMFQNWVSNTHFAMGFETINKTLTPIFIGVVFAFILCPVYNMCVRLLYATMLTGTTRRGFSLGSMIVHGEPGEYTVQPEDKKRILNLARLFASLVCVIIVVGIIGLLIYFVVPTVLQNGISLADTLPQRLATLSDWLETHFSRFPMLATWVDNVANAGTNDIIRWVQEHILMGNAMSIASMISSGVLAAVKYVANVFIGILIMVYLLNFKETLFGICRKFVTATCGQKRQEVLYEFADIVNETFIGFIVGRIIDSFIIGVLTFITLKICGIQFALFISVIVGVTNIIPFFGPFIGAIPSIFILMLEQPIQALYFIIIIIVIQQIDGNIIGPKIVGNVIGIGSFWVLIAVLVGGGLFGFPGMALGVPVFAVFYRYVNKLTTRSLERKNKAAHTVDYVSLEKFGIEDGEIQLDPPYKKRQDSILKKFGKKFSKNEFGTEEETEDTEEDT